MNELDTLVFLGLPKVGRKTVKKIIDLKTINTPIEKPGDYINILQTILPKVADSLTIQDIERAIYYAKKTIDDSSNKGIEIIGYRNPLYPELLKRLEGDAPVILYAKGNISVL